MTIENNGIDRAAYAAAKADPEWEGVIGELEDTIDRLEDIIRDLRDEIDRLEATSEEKDEKIDDLTSALNDIYDTAKQAI